MRPVKIHYPPDVGEKRFLDLFFSFDRLYRRRHVMRASLPEEWETMGEKLSGELGRNVFLPADRGRSPPRLQRRHQVGAPGRAHGLSSPCRFRDHRDRV